MLTYPWCRVHTPHVSHTALHRSPAADTPLRLVSAVLANDILSHAGFATCLPSAPTGARGTECGAYEPVVALRAERTELR
jgi:hypothetical protein